MSNPIMIVRSPYTRKIEYFRIGKRDPDPLILKQAVHKFYSHYYPRFMERKRHHMETIGTYRVYEVKKMLSYFEGMGFTYKRYLYSLEFI